MDTNKFKHGGDLEKVASSFGLSPGEILDFSANINFLGTPPGFKKAVYRSMKKIVNYPDVDSQGLSKSIGNYYGLDPSQILCGNGASELIYVLTHALKSRRILIPCPSFSEYEGAATGAGIEYDFIFLSEAEGFYPHPEHIIPCLPRGGLLFLCSPNNPTGILAKKEDLLAVIDEAAKLKTVVVIDESFMDFVLDETKYSFLRDDHIPTNLVILRSLTKFFALPGLRLGFLRADICLKEKIKASLPPWNVNVFAQEGGKLLFNDASVIDSYKEKVNREKVFLYRELEKIPSLRPFPPAANYIFLKIEKGPDSLQLQRLLGRRGVYIRDCSTFRGLPPLFFRVAVRSRRENRVLIEKLQEVFLSYPPRRPSLL